MAWSPQNALRSFTTPCLCSCQFLDLKLLSLHCRPMTAQDIMSSREPLVPWPVKATLFSPTSLRGNLPLGTFHSVNRINFVSSASPARHKDPKCDSSACRVSASNPVTGPLTAVVQSTDARWNDPRKPAALRSQFLVP